MFAFSVLYLFLGCSNPSLACRARVDTFLAPLFAIQTPSQRVSTYSSIFTYFYSFPVSTCKSRRSLKIVSWYPIDNYFSSWSLWCQYFIHIYISCPSISMSYFWVGSSRGNVLLGVLSDSPLACLLPLDI